MVASIIVRGGGDDVHRLTHIIADHFGDLADCMVFITGVENLTVDHLVWVLQALHIQIGHVFDIDVGTFLRPAKDRNLVIIDGGTDASVQDAIVVKLDSSGGEVWASQDHGAVSQSGNGIVFDSAATSVISRLGLPTGELPAAPPDEILSTTTLRPGQYFSIRIDGGITKRIEIETDDTLGFLSYKIKKALGNFGTSNVIRNIDDSSLKIEAKNGGVVEILAGPEDFDALAPLGFKEATLYAAPEGLDDDEEKEIKSSIFELGLIGEMSLETKAKASEVGVLIDSALREVRKMFRYIAIGPEADFKPPINIKSADRERLAQMQGALGAISSIASSINITNQMRAQGLGGGSVQNMFNIVT